MVYYCSRECQKVCLCVSVTAGVFQKVCFCVSMVYYCSRECQKVLFSVRCVSVTLETFRMRQATLAAVCV